MHTKQQLVLALLACGLVLSFVVTTTVATTNTTPNDLGEIEIREYEGQDLSSIDAFRENSIKGPQYIDNENYIFWEGVLIKDLLEEAQVNPEATTVIFYAYDGYSTSLPLDYMIDNNIMIAHKMNNVTLPPERGYPFQLVAESKFGYKWIKWITAIELSNNEDYRGYWESRGYMNDADLGDIPYTGNFVDLGNSIPEFPSQITLPLLIVIPLFAIIFRKKLFKCFD